MNPIEVWYNDKELNAFYTTYKIKFVENPLEGHSEDDEEIEDTLGVSDFDYHEIRIKKGLDERVTREVLIHEITHVMLEVCGLGGHPNEADSKMTLPRISNEELVTRVSRAMAMFFTYNPDLRTLLFNDNT